MDEKIYSIPPGDIILKKNLPRYRITAQKVKDLAISIKEKGQLQPIIITDNNELIIGGRRLAACLILQQNVLCRYKAGLSDFELRELEIEENIQREDLSPAEYALAVKDLHKIKIALHGQAQSGKEGGWRLEDTAEMIGKTKGSVINHLKIADTIDDFPELKKCKTQKEIVKAEKAITKLLHRVKASEEYENTVTEEYPKLYLGDAYEVMEKLEDKSIDLILTDPLYGIQADKDAIAIGGVTGGLTNSGFRYKDSKNPIKEYEKMAPLFYKKTKDNGHLYLFHAFEYFTSLYEIFKKEGWIPYFRPIMWIKATSGASHNPQYWPTSCYECIFFCRKNDSKLTKEGQPNWIQVDKVHSSKRTHEAEKPIDLLTNLIERTSLPGHVILDPFAGSGSSLIAGLKMQMLPIGIDYDELCYKTMQSNILKFKEGEKDGYY